MTAVPWRLTLLEQESPQAARLAEYASLAVRLDTGLLRRLRLALLPEADVHVESDLWFSPVVESRGPDGFQISPAVLEILRDRLAAAPPDVRARVRAQLDEAHVNASPAIRLEERVNGLAVEGGEAAKPAIEAELRKALRTFATSPADATDIARWAVHAAQRLHPIARDTAAAQALFFAAALTLRLPRATGSGAPSALPIADVAWPVQNLSLPNVELGVTFVTGGLQFHEPAGTASAIQVPGTDPVLVQLEWREGSTVTRELHEAAIGAVVPLHGDPSEVTLTTLAGDQYRLEARPSEGALRDRERRWPSSEFLSACVRLRRPGDAEASRTAFAVEPEMLITAGRGLENVPYLLDAANTPYFVLPREDVPSDQRRRDNGLADELVALRATTPVNATVMVNAERTVSRDEVRVAVPGFDEAKPVWRDATLQPFYGVPRARDGVVLKPSASDLQALAGSPIFEADDVIGSVLALTSADVSHNIAHVDVLSPNYLQSLMTARRAALARHKASSARVFISSTVLDLAPFRDAARDAVLGLGHVPVGSMESLPSTSPTVEGRLSAVDAADLYIGIIGWRYGYVPVPESAEAESLSVVELEYRRARERNTPCLIFMASAELRRLPDTPDIDAQRLSQFRQTLLEQHAVHQFSSVDELRRLITEAVARWQQSRQDAPAQRASVPESIQRLTIEIRDVGGRFEFRASGGQFSMATVMTAERRRLDELLSKAPPFALARGVLDAASDLVLAPQLRSAMNASSDVVLKLDQTCARYPWELLLADWSMSPPTMWLSMVRSIERTSYRAVSFLGSGKALGLVAGRGQDSMEIAKLEETARFDVKLVYAANAKEAMKALMEAPECVYLAGPPTLRDGQPGIEFGDGEITPQDFNSLRTPPRLVCIQLKHVRDWRDVPEFSARFADGLVSAGVAAVICQGWAVESYGASAFANYLFSNPRLPLSELVRGARQATFHGKEPFDWAAFHCYGDPDFRLVREDDRAPIRPSKATPRSETPPAREERSSRVASPRKAKRPVKARRKKTTARSGGGTFETFRSMSRSAGRPKKKGGKKK